LKKGKILIISTTAVMLSLSGFLIFNFVIKPIEKNNSNNSGTASAMTVPETIENNQGDSGNYTYIPPTFEYDDNNSNEDVPNMDNRPTDIPWTPATEMDLEPSSITVFVNKEYALPKDYVPDDLIYPDVPFDINGLDERKQLRAPAAIALEQLFYAAKMDGYTLYGISGYRSYERQTKIFTDNIVKRGKKHTIKYSAVPGTSEHQTGLSIDVSSQSMKYKLVTGFANCPEGLWLAKNAHYFGFIIRYPENRMEVTGYAYEPWHIRYVGKDLANYLYDNDLTLDEYYHYTPSPDFDFEATYAEFINYVPPITPTPTPSISPVPVIGDLDGDGITDDFDGDGLADNADEDTEDPEDAEEDDTEDPEDTTAPEDSNPVDSNPETDTPSDDATGEDSGDISTENPEDGGSETTPDEGTATEENGSTSEGTISPTPTVVPGADIPVN
jgi:D-alanyl-D-alanine carboxypeptidase